MSVASESKAQKISDLPPKTGKWPSLLRSALGIVAGLALIAAIGLGGDEALKRMVPQSFGAAGRVEAVPILLVMLAETAIAVVLGAYLAAWIARRKYVPHALILGAVLLILSIVNTATYFDTAPLWWHVLNLAAVLPAAWLGGWLRARQS